MSSKELEDTNRYIINHLQGNFPIQTNPFDQLEARWDIPSHEIIQRIDRLNQDDYLSRFGAVISTRALGGDSRLAALQAGDDDIEEVVDTLNNYRTVTHNYLRDHDLNFWFVLSADAKQKIDSTLSQLRDRLDRRVYDLPKLSEYYVGLRFHFHEDGSVSTKNIPGQLDRIEGDTSPGEPNPTPEKRRLIRIIQDGLPVEPRPYETIAQQAERSVGTVIDLCQKMHEERILKRLGCVPNHYKLGVEGNAMSVFDIPDNKIDKVGEQLGKRPEVTHCYERPRHKPVWPYNLFAMVHADTKTKAREKVEAICKDEGLTGNPHEILFSKHKYKKTGLRL